MSISDKQIEHLAKLARVAITDEEKHQLQKQVGDILDFVSQLNKLDTKGIEPAFYLSDKKQSQRDDEVLPFTDRDDILSVMPETENDLLKTPKIL